MQRWCDWIDRECERPRVPLSSKVVLGLKELWAHRAGLTGGELSELLCCENRQVVRWSVLLEWGGIVLDHDGRDGVSRRWRLPREGALLAPLARPRHARDPNAFGPFALLEFLRLLSRYREGLSLNELTELTGRSRRQVYRYLDAADEVGLWIERELAPKGHADEGLVLLRLDPRQHFMGFLRELHRTGRGGRRVLRALSPYAEQLSLFGWPPEEAPGDNEDEARADWVPPHFPSESNPPFGAPRFRNSPQQSLWA